MAVFRSPPDHAQKKSAHAAEQTRPDIVKSREDWVALQPILAWSSLVFIDATWASTSMARQRGRSAKGGAQVRNAIEAIGAELRYLPPYSPDFNPIENSFSKIKANLRKAASRTITELWQAIANVIPKITATECTNYFINAGYNPI